LKGCPKSFSMWCWCITKIIPRVYLILQIWCFTKIMAGC